MNKVIFAFCFACVSVGAVFAAPTLNLSEKSKSFLENRKYSGSHRSKDLGSVALRKAGDAKDISKSLIVVKESSDKNIKKIEKAISEQGFAVDLEDDGLLMAVMMPDSKNQVKVDVSCLSYDERECANKIFAKVLPADVAEQYDHLSTGRSIVQQMDGTKEIGSYVFNYMRVFNGRVVRGFNDISIHVSGMGVVTHVTAQMEDLAVSKDYMSTSDNRMENALVLEQLIAEDYTEVSSSEDDKVVVSSVDVNGVAEAYCPIAEGEGYVYHPCLSYTAQVNLENGDNFSYIFDAPYTKASLDKYKGRKAVVGNF